MPPPLRYAVFCGRITEGDDGSAAAALRRALAVACDVEEGSGAGRLAPESLAVAELVPLPLPLNDQRFFAYFAGRTQVCGGGEGGGRQEEGGGREEAESLWCVCVCGGGGGEEEVWGTHKDRGGREGREGLYTAASQRTRV